MTVFRCRICTHPTLAAAPPSRCPACGAGPQWLPAAVAFQPAAGFDLAGKLRDDFERLQLLLIDNSRFFRAAAKVADEEEGRALLQALTGVAVTQASVVSGLLGEALPTLATEPGDCSPAHRENLAESRQRVEEVLALCQLLCDAAPQGWTQDVAVALGGAGRDHLELLGS